MVLYPESSLRVRVLDSAGRSVDGVRVSLSGRSPGLPSLRAQQRLTPESPGFDGVTLDGEVTILLWQASSTGRYNHKWDDENINYTDPDTGNMLERELDPFFQYWGHTVTDAKGAYNFKTIIPGDYPADLRSGWFRPPHLHFLVQADGFSHLITQTYFKGEQLTDNERIQKLNSRDGVLRRRGCKEDQDRLIIEYKSDPTGNIKDGLVGQFDFQLES